jgi:hypothetical protein
LLDCLTVIQDVCPFWQLAAMAAGAVPTVEKPAMEVKKRTPARRSALSHGPRMLVLSG